MSGAVFSWRGVRDDKELKLVDRYLAPASVPGLKCWQLQLPDNVQFLSAAYELLSRLGFEAVWDTTEDTLEAWECAALGSAIKLEECEEVVPQAYSWAQTLFFQDFLPSGGEILVTTLNSSLWGQMYTRPYSFDEEHSYYTYVALGAGDWLVKLWGATSPDAGKWECYLDDELQDGPTDWYSASQVALIRSFTMTISEAGLHKVEFVANGKNASSSGYSLRLSFVTLAYQPET